MIDTSEDSPEPGTTEAPPSKLSSFLSVVRKVLQWIGFIVMAFFALALAITGNWFIDFVTLIATGLTFPFTTTFLKRQNFSLTLKRIRPWIWGPGLMLFAILLMAFGDTFHARAEHKSPPPQKEGFDSQARAAERKATWLANAPARAEAEKKRKEAEKIKAEKKAKLAAAKAKEQREAAQAAAKAKEQKKAAPAAKPKDYQTYPFKLVTILSQPSTFGGMECSLQVTGKGWHQSSFDGRWNATLKRAFGQNEVSCLLESSAISTVERIELEAEFYQPGLYEDAMLLQFAQSAQVLMHPTSPPREFAEAVVNKSGWSNAQWELRRDSYANGGFGLVLKKLGSR